MAIYIQANEDHIKLLNEVIHKYHTRLESAGVTIGMLFVFAEIDDQGELTGPALKLHGIPAAAVVKSLSLKLRAHGLPDIELLIDGDGWDDRPKKEMVAILDHELTHVEPVFKDNALQLDRLGRPRTVMRPHDYDFGWFIEVVERHNAASIESKQAKQFMMQSGQLFLDLTFPVD